MILIDAKDLSHSLGRHELFGSISFSLHDTERTALVGDNGCGKSTLLALLAQRLAPDGGQVVHRRGLRLGCVEQFVPQDLLGVTVFEAVASSSPWQGEQARPWAVEEILSRLGFAPTQWRVAVSTLSGGWKCRMLLARALAAEPDFLLLDEPTNHMDLPTLMFFEDFLSELTIPFLVVSHDREFLDTATDRTLILRQGRLHDLPYSYSRARSELEAQDEADRQRREDELRNLSRVTKSMEQLARWGKLYRNEKFSQRAESMRKRIERMREELTWVAADDGRKLQIGAQDVKLKFALVAQDAHISIPGGRELFSIPGLGIARGDRIALLGANGCGKSVFLRLLAALHSQQAITGISHPGLRFNPQLTLGYYDQMLASVPLDVPLFRIVREAMTGSDHEVRVKLMSAGFPLDDTQKTAKELSGGERARLQILLLSLRRPGILILDEPTNHIDIAGCEALEKEIVTSGVTTLFASHDRRFVSNVANRFLLIHKGRLSEVPSPDVSYALEWREAFEEILPAAAGSQPPLPPDSAKSQDEALALLLEVEEKIAAEMRQKPQKRNPRRLAELEKDRVMLMESLSLPSR